VGAGPAGAFAAHQLSALGARVLIVEKKRFPRSKVCGACLSRQALEVLQSAELGHLVARQGGIEIDELELGFRGRSARLSLASGAVLSRARLDSALVAAAVDSGAQFLEETEAEVAEAGAGVRHVRLLRGGRTIETTARVVLVAAGLGLNHAAKSSRAQTTIMPGSRIGAGCQVSNAAHFYHAGTIYMAVGRAGYVGVVRLEDGMLNVAAAFEPAFVRRLGSPGSAGQKILTEGGLAPIPELEQVHWQGTPALTRQTRPLAQERLFRLGDAAGYVEPFTGEGIGWALASARALAPLALSAAERWDPGMIRTWSRLHRRLIGPRQRLCRAVAMVLRHDWMANLGFELCARAPRAATLVLERWNAPSLLTNASSAWPS
jgi:menaquinone-9 beta-reductase